jgi:hypothetical protein
MVQARLFALSTGAATQAQRPPEISASGAARWAGTPRELFGALVGDVDLVVVIGKGVPEASEVAQKAAGRYGSYQILRTPIRVVP